MSLKQLRYDQMIDEYQNKFVLRYPRDQFQPNETERHLDNYKQRGWTVFQFDLTTIIEEHDFCKMVKQRFGLEEWATNSVTDLIDGMEDIFEDFNLHKVLIYFDAVNSRMSHEMHDRIAVSMVCLASWATHFARVQQYEGNGLYAMTIVLARNQVYTGRSILNLNTKSMNTFGIACQMYYPEVYPGTIAD